MKKYLKLITLFMVVFMLASIALVGCTGTPDEEEVTNSAAPSDSAKEEDTKPTTISWWQFWNIGDEQDSIKPSIDEFMKNNPNIKVEVTKLGWGDGLTKIQTAIGAGTAPDILELGSTWVGMFSQSGTLTDLSKFITSEIKDKFVNWNLGEYEGKVYAFPWAVGTRTLAINHDLFTKAGLDPNKPPKDWNELLQCAKAIKEKCGVPGFNIAAGDPTGDYQGFGNFLYSAGGSLIVKDGDKYKAAVDSEESKKTLKFLKDLKAYSSCDNEANARMAFQSGKLGMVAIGAYLTPDMQKGGQSVKSWSYEVIPACPTTGKSLAFSGAEVLAIPDQSKNKEAAFKFLQYLADEKTAMKVCEATAFSILPSTKTVGDLEIFKNPGDNESAKRVGKFIDVSKDGKTWVPPIHPNTESIGMRVSTMIQEIFLNNKDIDKATKEAADDINKQYLK